jgi:hypothetical protein
MVPVTRRKTTIGIAVVCAAALSACESDRPYATDAVPPSIHIWPDSVHSGDDVGVYIEVSGFADARLDLKAFDGTLCAIGTALVDAGVADAAITDAGTGNMGSASECPSVVEFAFDGSPKTLAVVFNWEADNASGVITAVVTRDGRDELSTFRRISKEAPVDAGVDATEQDANPGDAPVGDSQ